MAILDEIDGALSTSIAGVLNNAGHGDVEVIWANENGPEPATTYCALTILNTEQQGRVDEESMVALTSSQAHYSTYYKLYVQIAFFGSSADEVALDFDDDILNNRIARMICQAQNITPISKTKVRSTPQKRDDKWVKHYVCDVFFTYAVRTAQDMTDFVEDFYTEFINPNDPTHPIISPP